MLEAPIQTHAFGNFPDLPSLDFVFAASGLLFILAFAFAPGDYVALAAFPDVKGTQFDPALFQPVCAVSDEVYRYLQAIILALVGRENYQDYAPLIAGGILRVRLELCVLESFVSEAVLPFIREKGLSWVLPLHETVETFLAGTVFAVATNFILLGSTKILSVLLAYFDAFFGFPLRIFGNVAWEGVYKNIEGRQIGPRDKEAAKDEGLKRMGRQATEVSDNLSASPGDVAVLALFGLSGLLRLVGEVSKTSRVFAENVDTFVGRYLIYSTVGYVALKFVHFKVFPEFP